MSATDPLPGITRDLSAEGPKTPIDWDELQPEPQMPARAYYSDALKLPGFGEQPHRCIPRKPVGFCDAHGHVTLASASPCETRSCPEHWRLWQRKAAVNVVARLAAFRYVQESAGKRMLHVVDAPDPRRHWTVDAFWDERSRSYDAVRGVGGRGGVVVPHAYRTSEDGDWLFEQAVSRGDWEKERGRWSLLRDAADDWDEMQQFVEPSPHYHHLVAAENFDPAEIPAGRVVKNIRSLERFKIRDMTGYRDMARLAMYLLSHSALEPSGNRQTVTYWGDVHPNCFSPEEELTTTEWDRIQRNAERAVTTQPSDDIHDAGSSEPELLDCQHEECGGQVIPIWDLGEWLENGEFVGRLGRRQKQILKGVMIWLEEGGDRPPPSSREPMIREWLATIGREREFSDQIGLGGFTELWP